MKSRQRQDILGVQVDNLNELDAAELAASMIGDGIKHYVVTPNSEIIHMAGRDTALRDALSNADIALADGIGVVYASRILGRPIACRAAGIDFACILLRKMAERRMKLFLLGAKPGVAEIAAKNLLSANPGLVVSGICNGYVSDAEMISAINSSGGADVVFVCLGVPRQELWMRQNLSQVNASLLVGLGGSLDVFAGTVQRAPEKWRKLNLEWMYRILNDPRRIGRAMRLPRFLLSAIAARITGK